ncbi:acetoacetyl-CoA reductase [Bradyrhizobium elkanii]|uniref:SDR family oxidoreductase n=1 Tax=Bradyrhizobium TaxID=374 RepID=UPI002711E1CC|nr:SDR family oxidoreductase [Bradyrhizobium elkanii]WLA38746.1 SDR family oxidoreductase [Bradyrhizobium elkanii]
MARVALVTGGSRGIGAAISRALAAIGCRVAACYAGNAEAARSFQDQTGIPVFQWDVANFQACAAGISEVEAALGPIDILVNNAGIVRDATLHRMTKLQWNAVIRTDLDSLFNMCRPRAAELGFTRALALESARFGITVNAICPGYINTEMLAAVPADVMQNSILPQIPVGRLGQPEEIARAVAFLAADEAGFITGSTLSINGGQYMC